jgi:hypothetical protein
LPPLGFTTTTTTTKLLAPNKLGYARNETQSEIIEIKDLKDQKSMNIIVIMIMMRFGISPQTSQNN